MSDQINNGGPAFPLPFNWQDKSLNGMTLRDYFAAHAPEPPKNWHGGERSKDALVAWRWSYADAMLRARGDK